MSAVLESPLADSGEMPVPLIFTDSAADKVRDLVAEEGNPELKLRVFVQGGGCSGFQYGFTFDEAVNEDDTQMRRWTKSSPAATTARSWSGCSACSTVRNTSAVRPRPA